MYQVLVHGIEAEPAKCVLISEQTQMATSSISQILIS